MLDPLSREVVYFALEISCDVIIVSILCVWVEGVQVDDVDVLKLWLVWGWTRAVEGWEAGFADDVT